ncbi:nuclear transport factor 2 family protein [Pseudonocardia xinjiangensis]|uniref:Nuclear transport factor 2 family protein n=1 Tax=Pseudonocardia xinjiangensis TaxID=75289 RepID=A0ABX1RHJ3_9PSEU|nr:nuclear transport factor 2 family protein [Pseudonocardia xinjiangensis]NMH79857.1 nuclear transport factor 2 family protein [Pseudonocardia xinjiangensis]
MTTSPPAPVRQLLDAANRGDVDGFLSSFTADGVVDDWGREFRGSSEIRSWSDAEFIGVRVSLTPTGVVERDGVVTVTAQVGGDGFTGPSQFSFHLQDGLVSRMTIRA